MIYVEACNEVKGSQIGRWTLFLGGGITNCPDWQGELSEKLSNTNLVVYNPRRKNFPINDATAAKSQIEWEYSHLKCSDLLVFWLSKGSLNPIVLYELGRWANSGLKCSKDIFIGIEPEYQRKEDVIIQTNLSFPDERIQYSDNISSIAERIISRTKELGAKLK